MTEQERLAWKRAIAEKEAIYKAAMKEFDRKFAVPVIGLLYSIPSWRRYNRAYRSLAATRGLYIQALKAEMIRIAEEIREGT